MEAPKQQSEFNMAVSYLNRLNSLLTACDIYSMQLDVYNWYHTLFALFREISTELSKEEIASYKKRFDNLIEKVNSWLNNTMRGNSKIENDLYTDLSNIEIDIRGVLKSTGLQNKMKDDPRFAK